MPARAVPCSYGPARASVTLSPSTRSLPCARCIPRSSPYDTGTLEGRRPPHAVLRAVRQPRRQAGGAAARWAGRRLQREDAALPRPGQVPHRAVRPARLRPFHAACRPGGQHHLGPGRGHREAARAAGDRALAGVRRQLGLDPGAGLRRNPSRARHRTGAARHLHAAPLGAGMVLPGGRQPPVPGRVGALPQADSGGGAPRPDRAPSIAA